MSLQFFELKSQNRNLNSLLCEIFTNLTVKVQKSGNQQKNTPHKHYALSIILSLYYLVLFYFPRASLIRSFPFDYSFCFQLREMLFDRLCSNTDLSSQACCCQLAVFRKKGDDFLPTLHPPKSSQDPSSCRCRSCGSG